jgi:hypothetical protein
MKAPRVMAFDPVLVAGASRAASLVGRNPSL